MLAAEIDWDSLSTAAAFGVGAVLGTIGTIIVTRVVIRLLVTERKRNDES